MSNIPTNKPSGHSSVMQQRATSTDGLDYFPTPPWATRALCEKLAESHDLSASTVWEPACGGGYMARPLAEYFHSVYATDIEDYTGIYPDQNEVTEFLTYHFRWEDWVITNPPFNRAAEFVQRGLEHAEVGVAMLARTSFLEGVGRYNSLFSYTPPTWVFQFSERVPMVKNRIDRKASTATSYCWVVREKGNPAETRLGWIAPCRKRLEKDADYGPVEDTEVLL